MATAAAEEVVPHKPYAEEVVPQKLQAEEEPPLAAVMEKPSHVVQDKPLAPPPHHYDSNALASNSLIYSPGYSVSLSLSSYMHEYDEYMCKINEFYFDF